MWHQGKDKKDRFVTLAEASLLALRKYWATHRHAATRIMDRGGLQKSFKVIVRDCGIHKPVTIHSLRPLPDTTS